MIRFWRLALVALFVVSVLFAPLAFGKEDNWAKYNRRLAKLEEKRVMEIRKLQLDHQKFVTKQNMNDNVDVRKLRKHEENLQKKVKKINDDYLKNIQKLERKRR